MFGLCPRKLGHLSYVRQRDILNPLWHSMKRFGSVYSAEGRQASMKYRLKLAPRFSSIYRRNIIRLISLLTKSEYGIFTACRRTRILRYDILMSFLTRFTANMGKTEGCRRYWTRTRFHILAQPDSLQRWR